MAAADAPAGAEIKKDLVCEEFFCAKDGARDPATLSAMERHGHDVVADIHRQLLEPLVRDGLRRTMTDPGEGHSRQQVRASDIAVPGGFRRLFVRREGQEEAPAFTPTPPAEWRHFLEQNAAIYTATVDAHGLEHGMSNLMTVFTFLKAMVGSFLLFVPHMFAEAGLGCAAAIIVCTGALSTHGMLHLMRCADKCSGTGHAYPDVGFAAFGAVGRVAVEFCLAGSQFLYCVGYPIFIAENMRAVFHALLGFEASVPALIAVQLAVLIPYCWVTRLDALGGAMLVANIGVWGSLLMIMAPIGEHLAIEGPQPTENLIVGQSLILFLSQAVVTFEGIGLVLPIKNAMKDSSAFVPMLLGSMGAITLIFVVTGSVGYMTFGKHTQIFVTLNLPPKSLAVLSVRFGFSLAVMLAYPLQLFPAIEILERGLLGSKASKAPVWHKRALRTVLVLVAVGLAFAARKQYDALVGFTGGLAAVPLAFCYPALFHLRLFWHEQSIRASLCDMSMAIFGLAVAVLCLVVSVNAVLTQ